MRILKHLLTFEDPVELRSAMEQSFTPSETPHVLSAGAEDQLSTCAAASQHTGSVRAVKKHTAVRQATE